MLSPVRPLPLWIMTVRHWCRALHFRFRDVKAKPTSSRSRMLSPALSDGPAARAGAQPLDGRNGRGERLVARRIVASFWPGRRYRRSVALARRPLPTRELRRSPTFAQILF